MKTSIAILFALVGSAAQAQNYPVSLSYECTNQAATPATIWIDRSNATGIWSFSNGTQTLELTAGANANGFTDYYYQTSISVPGGFVQPVTQIRLDLLFSDGITSPTPNTPNTVYEVQYNRNTYTCEMLATVSRPANQ